MASNTFQFVDEAHPMASTEVRLDSVAEEQGHGTGRILLVILRHHLDPGQTCPVLCQLNRKG